MWLPVPARARTGCVSFDLNFLRKGQALGTHSTSFNYLTETLQDSSDYPPRNGERPLLFPGRMITPSLRGAVKLRPSHASIFSIDLYLLTPECYVQKRAGPAAERGLGREKHMGQRSWSLCGPTWLRSRCSRCRDLAAFRKAADISAHAWESSIDNAGAVPPQTPNPQTPPETGRASRGLEPPSSSPQPMQGPAFPEIRVLTKTSITGSFWEV